MCDTGRVETTSLDGTVVGWDESGSGKPLLLVHGGASDSGAWSLVRPLLPVGLRVAAMDRRGRGRSGRGGHVHSLDVEADDVLSVAEALGGGVVVVGHSIGATIALQALRRSDGLIRAAALYEPPLPGMTPETPEAMIEALDAGRDDDALTIFLSDMVRLSDSEIAALRTSPMWENRVALIWTMRRESQSLSSHDRDLSRYGEIDIPVQLLVGTNTAPHHTEAILALTTVVPDTESTVFEGQGHAALAQAPKLVAGAITDLLRRID
jgi:pimeloyl-ACP methyl ester carboxylesterase